MNKQEVSTSIIKVVSHRVGKGEFLEGLFSIGMRYVHLFSISLVASLLLSLVMTVSGVRPSVLFGAVLSGMFIAITVSQAIVSGRILVGRYKIGQGDGTDYACFIMVFLVANNLPVLIPSFAVWLVSSMFQGELEELHPNMLFIKHNYDLFWSILFFGMIANLLSIFTYLQLCPLKKDER